jgi:hypothetical protein
VNTLSGPVSAVTERLQRQWETAAGEHIDVLDRMMRYTLDVTAWPAPGYDLNALEAAATACTAGSPRSTRPLAGGSTRPCPTGGMSSCRRTDD